MVAAAKQPIRIRAATVSAADCKLRLLDFPSRPRVPIRLVPGILRPRQPVSGHELAGSVDSAGKDVTPPNKGYRVSAAIPIGPRACAEYICPRENPETAAITTMPANLTHGEAAAVRCGGGGASEFLRKQWTAYRVRAEAGQRRRHRRVAAAAIVIGRAS